MEGVSVIYTQDQIRQMIAPIAEKYHLKAVFLFGSYARGDATESSDVDLLVDTARNVPQEPVVPWRAVL